MNSPRTQALWRRPGKPVVAGLLVLWLFLSALASANPSLHGWLHKDHQSPTHYCLVTVLEHGQSEVAYVFISTVPESVAVPVTALPCESFFVSHDTKLFPERGPPALA